VGVLDDVVLAFGPAGVTRQPAFLTQLVESGLTTRDDLVDVRLVSGVEQQPVSRGVEDPVQCQGQLNCAEVRPQMSPGPGHLGHEEIPNLSGQGG